MQWQKYLDQASDKPKSYISSIVTQANIQTFEPDKAKFSLYQRPNDPDGFLKSIGSFGDFRSYLSEATKYASRQKEDLSLADALKKTDSTLWQDPHIQFWLGLHEFYGILETTSARYWDLLKEYEGNDVMFPNGYVTVVEYLAQSLLIQRVGTQKKHFAFLSQPLKDRVYFGGEHTNREYRASAYRAYLSGIREDQRIYHTVMKK